jgi:hypothetical protein
MSASIPDLAPPRHSPFVEYLIRFLMPYFTVITSDLAAAHEEILETLASYGARSRSEMLNAVQILAFGLSALDVLTEAKAPDLSPSMRLRFRGCANGLNRSCQQNEKNLAKRLACDLPQDSEPGAEPANDMPQARVQETLQHAQAKIDTTRNRLSGARPATTPHPIPASREDSHKRAWGSAMMDALAELGDAQQ